MSDLTGQDLPSSRQYVESHLKTTIEHLAIAYSLITRSTFKLDLNGEVLLEAGLEHQSDAAANEQTILITFPVLGLGEVSISSSRSRLAAEDLLLIGERERKQLLDAMAAMTRRFISYAFTTQFLVANNIHEVMTGLSAVSGAAEYLAHATSIVDWKNNAQVVADIVSNAKTVYDQVQLGTSMIGNLMEVASGDFEQGDARPKLLPLNLGTEIERAAAIWSGTAARRGVSIKISIENDVTINGDRFHLRHLFDNLLSNAIKYSYRTTKRSDSRFVSVTVKRYDTENTRVGVYITNYGIGLLKEEQARIGEIGFRGTLARREQPLGFGIGVFVSRQIARMHGGFLRYKWSLLHDNEPAHGSSPEGIGGTYLVECVVVLPVLGRARRSTSG